MGDVGGSSFYLKRQNSDFSFLRKTDAKISCVHNHYIFHQLVTVLDLNSQMTLGSALSFP